MKKAACAPRPDGEATRARILEAAGELFAAHGYAEAASKAIAARAEVDLASINYHFGSRSGLYQAVLAEAHRRLMDVADLQRLAQSRLAATDKLRAVIGHLVGNALSGAENWHISVLTAEILAPLLPYPGAVRVRNPAEDRGGHGHRQRHQRHSPGRSRAATLPAQRHRAPPVAADRPARRSGPVQAMLRMPAETLVDHLSRFAIAGLEAIGRDYADSAPTRRKKK